MFDFGIVSVLTSVRRWGELEPVMARFFVLEFRDGTAYTAYTILPFCAHGIRGDQDITAVCRKCWPDWDDKTDILVESFLH